MSSFHFNDYFEMPGVGVSGISLIQPALEQPLLKAHKALPRKRDVLQQGITPMQIPSSDEDITQNSTPIATAPTLPLTPPGKTKEEFHGNEQVATQRRHFQPEHDMRAVTPPHQLSPPTPDTTPPWATSLKQKTGAYPPGQPSMSSRAESFRTAQEAFSSDEEAETLNRSAHSLWSSRRILSPRKISPANELSPQSDVSPVTPTSKKQGVVERVASFDSFDGQWIENREAESATSPSEQKYNLRCYRPNQNTKVEFPVAGGVNAKQLEVSLTREKSLRERVQESQNIPASRSTEKFGEDVGWHSMTNNKHLDLSERPNSWRLPGLSTASTVEAMVVDSPPQKRRTLRHMVKKASLRSASSPSPQWNPSSSVSIIESPHRLVHKAARISNKHRWSMTSVLSVSTSVASSELQQQPEVIPVVVIPERRSSLKSSSTPGSRNTSVTRSQGSTRRRKRAMSDSMTSISGSKEADSRGGRSITRPSIPPRSSSLSAPTTRDNSRAGSLTSESLRHHTLAMDLEFEKRHMKRPYQNSASKDRLHETRHSLEVSNQQVTPHGADETLSLRPPSLSRTQPSIPSSSPGPVEIREATAISLFPHNNRSLLLVDQQTPPESSYADQDPRTSHIHLGAPDHLQTPENSSKQASVDIESPLKNPRPPPKPPAFKIIPPTPMTEAERQPGGQESDQDKDQEENSTLIRRFGSVRRAFSGRRCSEPASPFTRTVSIRSARNQNAGKEIDSKLHPFWRPRGFLDELNKPEGEDPAKRDFVADDVVAVGRDYKGDNDMVVRNTLGMPQKRIVLEGPLSVVRRISGRRHDRSTLRNRSSQGSLAGRRGSGITRANSPYPSRRFHSIPRLGVQFRFMTLGEVQRQWRDARQQRENEKWEARKEKLKQSIGETILVDSSTESGNHGTV
ncbi:hypothetical protein VTN00DRAFT_622 [Thermoascus crustaceus]|uniref:uncharacterized protein n=1 Tax=Thermoascus crustaceus TaxID=5088 RepID=UPI003744AD27